MAKWSVEQNETLVKLIENNATYEDMALAIGKSICAIRGHISELRTAKRFDEKTLVHLTKKRKTNQIETQKPSTINHIGPIKNPILTSPIYSFKTCQYLNGEPRYRMFCGHPTKEGSSYCESHHKACYEIRARNNEIYLPKNI